MLMRTLVALATTLALTSVAAAQDTARYQLTIDATWSEETHPFQFW